MDVLMSTDLDMHNEIIKQLDGYYNNKQIPNNNISRSNGNRKETDSRGFHRQDL